MVIDEQTNQSKEAVLLGRRLGVLLAALEGNDEIRDAFITILPELTEQQLQELVQVLEQAAVQNVAGEADNEFTKTLERIRAEYESNQAATEAVAASELDALAAEMNSTRP